MRLQKIKAAVVAALATTAVVAHAPAALADEPEYGCRLFSVSQEYVAGASFEGVAAGYVAHSETGPVSVRCYVTVNGDEVSSTPTGTGTAAAATGGRVQFFAGPTDSVVLWAEVTTFHGAYTRPMETTVTHVPAQEVQDLLQSVAETVDAFIAPLRDVLLEFYVNPVLCPVLVALQGNYGPVLVDSEGDVYLDSLLKLWDCPPYSPAGSPLPEFAEVWVITGG